MKRFIEEAYAFRITVVDGKRNRNNALDCRNGHEIDDAYTCEYGCPRDFCSKCMMKVFPLMEAVRAGGDLRQLGGEGKHVMTFSCPDGVVMFRLEAFQK